MVFSELNAVLRWQFPNAAYEITLPGDLANDDIDFDTACVSWTDANTQPTQSELDTLYETYEPDEKQFEGEFLYDHADKFLKAVILWTANTANIAANTARTQIIDIYKTL